MPNASEVDFLVMGAGVAGLRAAIDLAAHGEVLVVTKEALGESNTHYAQGGIAVALEGDEDVSLHLEDTIKAGDGLVYKPAAEALVAEGPIRVSELIEWGARFDHEDGRLLRTREGAHSLPRILHASGDATGAEISRSLLAFARAHKCIRFADWTRVTALARSGNRVVGADLTSANGIHGAAPDQIDPNPTIIDRNGITRISARAVLIASGGAGQVYSDTTNPAVATGDGLALAAESGAELADMEFYQFHPTALSIPGAPRFLLSEALRGEGAFLRNDRGERFMEQVHPLLELAPRDVVARAIAREGMGETGEPRPVYLDMRHVRGVNLSERFPGISAVLARYGLDLSRDLIPVRPAAHYLMGGIRTDLVGRTSVGGLYAAGEAACTGVHGANRLASNSLLEGLVFGARAAQAMLGDALPRTKVEPVREDGKAPKPADEQQIESIVTELQTAMWAHAGLLRDAASLRLGLAAHSQCCARLAEISATPAPSRRLGEARSLCRVAGAILNAALARTESRGAHFRNDFPHRDDTNFRKHSVWTTGAPVVFEEW